MNPYSILSLFTWCGWLDLWFLWDFTFLEKKYKKNNFQLIWANDIDEKACLTFSKNFHHWIVCGDIREILANNQQGLLDTPPPDHIDVLLWGFPCQDFSHAGKRLWFDSSRGTLYQAMAEMIKKTSPKLFLAENVKGLLTMDNGQAIEKVISDFSELWYNIVYKLFLTADFWVPQKRERVVIVGTRKDILPPFVFPKPSLRTNKWITLWEAIGDLENIKEGGVKNHFWSKAKKNKWQWNSIIDKNGLGPTMRAEHHGNIEFHRNGQRRLSAREAARIQSFPDDFIFYPSTSSAYKQIGNAVPPVFARYLAKHIEKFLDKHCKRKDDK